MTLPTLFVSHGSPMLAVEPGQAGAMLSDLGRTLPPARAILVISAHWQTRVPTVSTAAQPETIHDFGGFPGVLYELQYPAPGAPALGEAIATRLTRAGIPATTDSRRGLDHGAWVPLRYLAPAAQVPVLQLSLPAGWSVAQHLACGRALQGLGDEHVLVMGSGSITHNLHEFEIDSTAEDPRARAFTAWIEARLADGALPALLDYRRQAPYASWAHPTEEHLMPLFVAIGAAAGWPVHRVLSGGIRDKVMSMDAYLFGAAPWLPDPFPNPQAQNPHGE
jgi:4,5-DOPA dioxygenase extradiol